MEKVEPKAQDSIEVRVRLFAVVREKAGVSELLLDLPRESCVVAVRRELSGRFPVGELLWKCAWAVNQEYASMETTLKSGDEVAVIPAVSGG